MRTLSGLGTALALLLVVDAVSAQDPAPRPLPSMPAPSQSAPVMVQPAPVVQSTVVRRTGRRGVLQRMRDRRLVRRGY